MKYFGELSEIEDEIIRLSSMSSVIRVIANGAEQSNEQDVKECLWYIEGSIESIHDNLRSKFNQLWETVSEDEHKEIVEKIKHKGGMSKKKNMTNRELP